MHACIHTYITYIHTYKQTYIHTYILVVYLALNLESWRIFDFFDTFLTFYLTFKKTKCRARTARKLDTLLGSGEAQGFCGRYIYRDPHLAGGEKQLLAG